MTEISKESKKEGFGELPNAAWKHAQGKTPTPQQKTEGEGLSTSENEKE